MGVNAERVEEAPREGEEGDLTEPWYESFFGEDYLEIYEGVLTPEVTEAQVGGIVSLLDLQPGTRILDLACGHGRIAIPLAQRGFDVTGYDLSEVFLRRARRDAEAQSATVQWIRGDVRNLDFDSEFDVVINVFTSFGYFEDPKDDLKVLEGVRRALKSQGRFLLETLHRDGLLPRFQPQGFDRTPSGSVVLHDRKWDLETDIMDDDITLIRADGAQTQYRTSVRTRSLREMLALTRQAGLEPEAWYGGLDGSPLTLQSFRLALLSRRP